LSVVDQRGGLVRDLIVDFVRDPELGDVDLGPAEVVFGKDAQRVGTNAAGDLFSIGGRPGARPAGDEPGGEQDRRGSCNERGNR
jgi:hypothetical protein